MQLTTIAVVLVGRARAGLASAWTRCTSRAVRRQPNIGAARLAQVRRPAAPVGAILLSVSAIVTLVAIVAHAQAPADPRTESERLAVEILTLKAQLARAIADADACRVELAPTRTQLNNLAISAEAEKLAGRMEASHPGYRVNRATWLLEAIPGTP